VRGVSEPATLADWLRPKRRFHTLVAAVMLLGGLAVPVLLAMLRADTRAVPASAWTRLVPFAQWHDALGLPLLLSPWLVPFALLTTVALVVLAFEALVFYLRVDRGDDAWSSLAWLVGAWRGWAPWLLAAAALLGAAAAVAVKVGGDASMAVFYGVVVLLALASPFIAWNARNLRTPRVDSAWRWGWPGWAAIGVVVVAIAFEVAWDAGAERLPTPSTWMIPVLLVLYKGIDLVVLVVVATVWLSRGRSPLPAARRALQPKVLLSLLVQQARLLLGFLLALLPIVPLVLALIFVIPQFETALFDCQCAPTGAWHWAIAASRFAVAWWWAALAVAIGLLISIFGVVALATMGRLLLQLGVVTPESD
jgi:hypothetical protein